MLFDEFYNQYNHKDAALHSITIAVDAIAQKI